MENSRFSEEQVVNKLREVDVELAKGKSMHEACPRWALARITSTSLPG